MQSPNCKALLMLIQRQGGVSDWPVRKIKDTKLVGRGDGQKSPGEVRKQ